MIKQPTAAAIDDTQDIVLHGYIIHFEQNNDNFYYSVHFHPFDEEEKRKLQQMFDYFSKKSEFRS